MKSRRPTTTGRPAGYKSPRAITVDGTVFSVTTGIARTSNGWRICIERVGEKTFQARFADSTHGSAAGALQAAERRLSQLDMRPAFQGISLSRSEIRVFNVERKVRKIKGGGMPHFALSVRPSQGHLLRGWMTVHLGSIETLEQDRVDYAVSVLAARWRRYRQESAKTDFATAVDAVDYRNIRPLRKHPYTLRCQDLRMWTGKGDNVTFSPSRTVDSDRCRAGSSRWYWPEMPGMCRENAGPWPANGVALSGPTRSV